MTTNVFLKKTGGTDVLYTATGSDIAIYGDVGGGETVLVSATASGLLVDPNIEKVTFDGAYTDFTFARAGNTDVLVYRGATLVATLRPQTDDDPDSNGTVIAFTSGAVSSTTLNITGAGAIRMGGVSGTFSQLLQTTAAAYVADTAAPAGPTAEAVGNKIVIQYTDDSELDAGHAPATSAFGVTLDGTTPVAVSSVAVDAAARTVTLTLATAITAGQAVALSYTDPSAGNDTNAIQDSNGNDAATDAAIATTNKTPGLVFSQTTFAEADANDGSITATATITLTNDTFTGAVGAALGTVSNLPAGLTATLVKTSDTQATLSFGGNATNHLDGHDVNNLSVVFGNADFAGGNAAAVTQATTTNLGFNFNNPTTFLYTGLPGHNVAALSAFDFGGGPKILYWNPLAANLESGTINMINMGVDDRIVVYNTSGANTHPVPVTTPIIYPTSTEEVSNTFSTPVKVWLYDTVTFKFQTWVNGGTTSTPRDTFTFTNQFRTLQIYSELDDTGDHNFAVTFQGLPSFYHPDPGVGYVFQVPIGTTGTFQMVPAYEAGGGFISFI